jgi:hypothetical protein
MTFKISKTHQRFLKRLKDQRVLSHPDEFLGPNWKEVLNFWFFLDTLSPEQRGLVWYRFEFMFGEKEQLRDKIFVLNEASHNIISFAFIDAATKASWSVSPGHAAGYATYELIGSHQILERGRSLTFVPLFL